MRRPATLLAALLAASVAAAAPLADAVDSITINVSDLERSVAFYGDVLHFEKVSEREVLGEDVERVYGVFGARVRLAKLKAGDELVELQQFLAPEGRPQPADTRSNDLWFQHVAIVVSDMERAYAWLREHRVRHASTGPQLLPAWNPNAGGISAFYFKDPDGNHLELLHFPPGKGDPKWQAPDGRLFLGIDHTAIVVADTEASLRHYRDLLGLRVAGTSENHGTEQEHLNNVFGARLRITALRAERGPGVELLEYLAPRTGRPPPADSQANDAWHWQVNFSTRDAGVAYRELAASGAALISPGAQPARELGLARALMIRDPDGHAAMLREPARVEQGSTPGGPAR